MTLSQQTVLPTDEDEVGTWIILSMILLFAVLFYRLSRQRETELELAKLREEQAEILERDYAALSRTYDENAKLYHDLHNHLEVLYHCLARGRPAPGADPERAHVRGGDLRALQGRGSAG